MTPESEQKPRAVLVTGATGFVGREIVRSFLGRGWQVTAAVHRTPVPDWMARAGVRSVEFSSRDLEPLEAAIEGSRAVCHAAAFLPPDYADSRYLERCLEINTVFSLRLAEVCASAHPDLRFVHLSSAQGYAADPGRPCVESDRLYPTDRASYYLTSKLAGEILVEHLRRFRGLTAIGLRVGSCYGAGMSPGSVVSLFMARARSGQPIVVQEGGSATADFVYVGDVATLAVLAAESGAPGMYNAGSGRASTILELARSTAATYPETDVAIEVSPHSREPEPGFPALSMQKANKTWYHRPTELRTGLAAMRRGIQNAGDTSSWT